MNKYIVIYIIGTIVTFVSTAVAYFIFGKYHMMMKIKNRETYLHIVLFAIILYVVIFSIMKDLTILSHHSYTDYAVFLELNKNLTEGEGLFCTIQEGIVPGTGHWLSTHFSPIAYLFWFPFWIWPSFHTINWAQTLILALSSVIFYQFTCSRIGAFSAMCLSISLLLNPTFQYITLYEFEYLRFVIPIGIFAVGLVVSQKSLYAILSAFAAVLLIREDAAFFVFGIGLYIFIFQKKRALGASVMVASVLYLMIILNVIMPYFRGAGNVTHIAAHGFKEFGTNPIEIIGNILQQPLKFLIHLFQPNKSVNYFMYLLPFSFVPLFATDILVMALPTAAMLAFSSFQTFSSYFLYYVSPILVTVIWATAIGISNIVNWINENDRVKAFFKFKSPLSKERLAFAVLCGAVACSIYFGPSPLSIQFWCKDFSLAPFRTNTFHLNRYQPTSHDAIVRKIAWSIPRDASVSTEQVMLQDVYRCKTIYIFPYIEKADYVLIDKTNPRKAYIRGNSQSYYDWVEKRPDVFQLVVSEDGILLYKRRQDAPPYPQPQREEYQPYG